MEEIKKRTKFCLGSLKETEPSDDLDVDGKNNFYMDLKEIGWEFVDWIHLAQDKDR
jgi:hypothetical protein